LLRASIPRAIDLAVVLDRTPTIRASLLEVERTLLISIALVVMWFFLFLRQSYRDPDPHSGRSSVPARHIRASCIFAGYSLNEMFSSTDDGIVHGRNPWPRSGHERQVIEAVTGEIHDAECAEQGHWNGHCGDQGRGSLRRNRKTTITTSAMEISSVRSTSSSEARMVGVRSSTTARSIARGIDALSNGRAARTRFTVAIMFAPGWRFRMTSTAACRQADPALRKS